MSTPETRARTHLAIRLYDWRKYWGLTQQQAANWLALSLSTYSRYERGVRSAPLNEWQRLIMRLDDPSEPLTQGYLVEFP